MKTLLQIHKLKKTYLISFRHHQRVLIGKEERRIYATI